MTFCRRVLNVVLQISPGNLGEQHEGTEKARDEAFEKWRPILGRPEEAVIELHDSVAPLQRPQRSEANEKKELMELKAKFAVQTAELSQTKKDKARLQTSNKTISNSLRTKDAALKSKEAEYVAVSKTAQAAADRIARLQAKYNSANTASASASTNAAESAASSLITERYKQNQEQMEYYRLKDIEMERAALSERTERHVRSETIKDNDHARKRDNITLAVTLAKGDAAYTALLLEHLHP